MCQNLEIVFVTRATLELQAATFSRRAEFWQTLTYKLQTRQNVARQNCRKQCWVSPLFQLRLRCCSFRHVWNDSFLIPRRFFRLHLCHIYLESRTNLATCNDQGQGLDHHHNWTTNDHSTGFNSIPQYNPLLYCVYTAKVFIEITLTKSNRILSPILDYYALVFMDAVNWVARGHNTIAVR